MLRCEIGGQYVTAPLMQKASARGSLRMVYTIYRYRDSALVERYHYQTRPCERGCMTELPSVYRLLSFLSTLIFPKSKRTDGRVLIADLRFLVRGSIR